MGCCCSCSKNDESQGIEDIQNRAEIPRTDENKTDVISTDVKSIVPSSPVRPVPTPRLRRDEGYDEAEYEEDEDDEYENDEDEDDEAEDEDDEDEDDEAEDDEAEDEEDEDEHDSSFSNYVVIDTNVLFDRRFKIEKFIADSDACVVIPSIVMKELRGLQSCAPHPSSHRRRKSWKERRARRARWAYNSIRRHLSKGHPRVLGLEGDYGDWIDYFQPESNDDVILQNCLALMEDYPSSKVQLFTQDKRLQDDASSYAVDVISLPPLVH